MGFTRALFVALAVALAPWALAQGTVIRDTGAEAAQIAYVKAVTYFQSQLNRVETDRKIQQAVANGENRAMRAQLDAVMKELAALRAEAAQNKAAGAALAAFAENEPEKGLDALEAEAKAQSAKALAQWKRIGALAFAIDTQRAIRAYQEALKLAPDDGEILSRLGWLYTRVGALGDAAEMANRLMQSPDPALRIRGQLDAGRTALSQGNALRAMAFFREAYSGAETAKREPERAEALTGLGAAAQLSDNWVQAEGFLREAVSAYRALKDEAGEAEALLGLAGAARLRGVWVVSEAALSEAIPIFERNEDGVRLAQALLGRGETGLLRGGPPIAALSDFHRAQQAFLNLGDLAGQAASAKGLGDASDKLNRPREACMYWRMGSGLYARLGAFTSPANRDVETKLREKCR